MDDPKNAKQAYEHSLSIDSENVYTNLNYAVFLYNQGDKQGAATRLITFRKIFDTIIQGKRKEIDPEVSYLSSKVVQSNEFVILNFYLVNFKASRDIFKVGPDIECWRAGQASVSYSTRAAGRDRQCAVLERDLGSKVHKHHEADGRER